jgi:hypothetical protein
MGMSDAKARARSGRKARDHSHQRFGLRFDIELTPAIRREIVEMIQTGRSTCVEKQSNRIALHRVEIEGKSVVVVYDKLRAAIVTALYPEGEWPIANDQRCALDCRGATVIPLVGTASR